MYWKSELLSKQVLELHKNQMARLAILSQYCPKINRSFYERICNIYPKSVVFRVDVSCESIMWIHHESRREAYGRPNATKTTTQKIDL